MATKETQRRIYDRLIVASLTVCSFGVMASALKRVPGFTLDDSYIHQTVARNFVLHGVPGLVPGARSSGSTSVLWTYVQAAKYVAFPSTNPVLFNAWLSLVLIVLISQLLYTMAEKDKLVTQSRIAVAGGAALCGNFLWLGFLGMEHLLFVALSLSAILLWCSTNESGRRRSAILTGIFAGLIALTRPEGMFFVLLVSVMARRVGRSWKEARLALVAWLPPIALMFASNLYTSGTLLPATYAGRSWLYFHSHGGPHGLWAIRTLVGSWASRMPKMLDAYLALPIANNVRGIFIGLLACAFIILLIMGVRNLVRSGASRLVFLCVWCALDMLIYACTFPNSGNGGRYQPLFLLLAFPLVFLGMFEVLYDATPASASWARDLTWIPILAIGVCSIWTWRIVTVDGIAHIRNTHGQMASWILKNIPADVSIASFDIGKISYELSGRTVIDLGGLADPAYMPYLVRGEIAPYLAQHNVQYVVLPSGYLDVLGLDSGGQVGGPLVQFCSPHDVWLLGFATTHHAAPCQLIYHFQPDHQAKPL
jgi:hypothetical protein